MINVSPLHGRSYVVGRTREGRYIISKGNGLSYSQYLFINTGEIGDESLGMLLRKDAFRDFNMGIEIASYGIKTNQMEYVLELSEMLALPSGNIIRPVLLQYDVECPYRICDVAFMEPSELKKYVSKWGIESKSEYNYLIAAECLIRNLRILHDNGILHNAITVHNITWSLELVDFELSCSPSIPYDTEEENRHVKDLFSREIIETYKIVKYIACVLKEQFNDFIIDKLFEKYGFDLCNYKLQEL